MQVGVECCQEDPAASVEEEPSAQPEWEGTSDRQGVGPGYNDVLPLKGLTISITGSCRRGGFDKRDLFRRAVEAKGGQFKDSVTKATDWLVEGVRAGKNKLADAARLGVKVLTEEEYHDEVERLTHKKQGYEVGD
eukprot:gene4502-4755_t